MPEREPSYEKYLLPITTLGLLAIATMGAFSKESRKKIRQRDGNKSAWSGETGILHAAHIDHSRNERYDDPSNGRLLTPREHYIDHYNRHGRNGLTRSGNKWALTKLWELLTGSEKDGLEPPDSL